MLNDGTSVGLAGGRYEFGDKGGCGHIEGEVIDLDDIVPEKGDFGDVVGSVDVAEVQLQDFVQTSKLVVHTHRLVHPLPYIDLPKFGKVIGINGYELDAICCDEYVV